MSHEVIEKIDKINQNIRLTRQGVPAEPEKLRKREQEMRDILHVMNTRKASQELLWHESPILFGADFIRMYRYELAELSNTINKRKARSLEPFEVDVAGKPTYLIHATEPLIATGYGLVKNRAPFVEGTFALHSLSTFVRSNGGVRIIENYTLPSDQSTGYGFLANAANPQHTVLLNRIAEYYGVSGTFTST